MVFVVFWDATLCNRVLAEYEEVMDVKLILFTMLGMRRNIFTNKTS